MSSSLFTERETQALAHQFEDTLAPAKLLGMATIHQQAERKFSDLRTFDDLGPMAPHRAIEWFKSLVPGIVADATAITAEVVREAFTLAVTTSKVLLAKVKDIIGERLETGENIQGTAKEIDDVLDQAGVSVENPSYSEMVYRTNMMQAYQRGSEDALMEVADVFPVWQWSNPNDGRSRPTHAARNGALYPTSIRFTDVRDSKEYEGFNCRCQQIPIDKYEAQKLRDAGVELAEGNWSDVFGD